MTYKKDRTKKPLKNYNVGKKRSMQPLVACLQSEARLKKLVMYVPGKHQASKKGHKHEHNPTYKPPKALSPAEWKRQRRQAK